MAFPTQPMKATKPLKTKQPNRADKVKALLAKNVPKPNSPANPASPFGQDTIMAPMNPMEYVIPEPVVRKLGTDYFDNLVKSTLSEVMPPDEAQQGGTGTPATGFKYGGGVFNPSADDGYYGKKFMPQAETSNDPQSPNGWGSPRAIQQNLPASPWGNPTGQGQNNPNSPWGNPMAETSYQGQGPDDPPESPDDGGWNGFMTRWGDLHPNQHWNNPAWRQGHELGNEPTDSRGYNQFFNLGGFGTWPGSGSPISGGTMVPTYWKDQGNGIFAPMAVPLGGWGSDPSAGQAGQMVNPHQIRAKEES